MNFLKKYGKYGQALLICMIALAVGLGCNGKSNPGNQSEGDIVCKEGEAWIEEGKDGGYIFAQNGDLKSVVVSDGRSKGGKIGTYSTSGVELTLVFEDAGYSTTVTYKVSGDEMTLSSGGETKTYKKRTGVHIDG
jgi:hypothetical protein